MIVEPSLSAIAYTYVWPADSDPVLMLKIHCCALGSQRNAVSGVVDDTGSSVLVTVPLMICTSMKLFTTPGVPTDTPLASQTRNFAGTVRPCFQTEVPLTSIG